jgi:hypothetical protein
VSFSAVILRLAGDASERFSESLESNDGNEDRHAKGTQTLFLYHVFKFERSGADFVEATLEDK